MQTVYESLAYAKRGERILALSNQAVEIDAMFQTEAALKKPSAMNVARLAKAFRETLVSIREETGKTDEEAKSFFQSYLAAEEEHKAEMAKLESN